MAGIHRSAAEVLGTPLWPLDELIADALCGLLTELRSEIVLTHNADNIHPDHQQAAQTLLARPGHSFGRISWSRMCARRSSERWQATRCPADPVVRSSGRLVLACPLVSSA
jgi:hypothetical protein